VLKVVFGFDGSQASLSVASKIGAMASWWKVDELCALNVQPQPKGLGEPLPFELQQRAETLARSAGDQLLESALAVLGPRYSSVTSAVVFGDAATRIAEEAESSGNVLIALGSHGAGALFGYPIGSVTHKVLHISARPVLVMPALRDDTSAHGPPQRPVRILIAVDGSPDSLAAVRQAVQLMPAFVSPPEIHLVAVYDKSPMDVEIGAMLSAKALSDYEREYFEAAIKPARGLLAGTRLAVTEHTLIGTPALRIQELASSQRCDIVCIGTRGQGRLRGLILGSTTAKLLHTAGVPLLVVRHSPTSASLSS